ncbi:hypothetical protein AB6A40_002744 [Gnathostoma spinigerum]|uniref:Uncharacterized protein n=1 Tax=Gnathostoma spinigerum TaxID=75299 RepID=A0ABD6EIA4_9BILA
MADTGAINPKTLVASEPFDRSGFVYVVLYHRFLHGAEAMLSMHSNVPHRLGPNMLERLGFMYILALL